jgi:hypothetical protein
MLPGWTQEVSHVTATTTDPLPARAVVDTAYRTPLSTAAFKQGELSSWAVKLTNVYC